MGVSHAPDLCQEMMESILHDIPDVEVFLDNIGIFSQDYLSHMKTIATVLTRLQANGFTVNPLKCEWAVKETDWLGYWLTPTGLNRFKRFKGFNPRTTTVKFHWCSELFIVICGRNVHICYLN